MKKSLLGLLFFAIMIFQFHGLSEPVKVQVKIDVQSIGRDPGFIEFKIESDSEGEKATGHLRKAESYQFTWNMGNSGGNNIWFWWDTLDGTARIQMWVNDKLTLDADCNSKGDGEKNVLVFATRKRVCFMRPKGYLKHGSKPNIIYIEASGFLGIVWNDQNGAAHKWDAGGGHYYRYYQPKISKASNGWYASTSIDHDISCYPDDHSCIEWWFDSKGDLVQVKVSNILGRLNTEPIRLAVNVAASVTGYPEIGMIADKVLEAIEKLANWLAEGEGRRKFPIQIRHVINDLGCKIHDLIRTGEHNDR